MGVKVSLLARDNTGLVIVDAQERLMTVMGNGARTIKNIQALIHLARLFSLPIIVTEQYPRWLGPTVEGVRELITPFEPIEKMEFNCCAVGRFNDLIKSRDLRNIILTGVESHICIFQTCIALLEKGYNVHVPCDAVDSRVEENRLVGLHLMNENGAVITSTETVIFQILQRAGTREFKEMSKIIK
jgi:nicotinamidase-related amidase